MIRFLPFIAGLLCGSAVLAAETPSPIHLPPPRTVGGKPLLQALKERQSIREFSRRPIPPQVMSDLLWAAFGVNRATSGHRTAPSAMNSQEVDLYLATAEGLFLFDAPAHRLTRVLTEDLRSQTGGQAFVKEAPLALIFVADLARLSKARPEDREFYAAMDTGFISQNVYLFCASEGLGTVVHDLNKPALAKVMKLRPEQKVMIAQTVGYPRSQTDALRPGP